MDPETGDPIHRFPVQNTFNANVDCLVLVHPSYPHHLLGIFKNLSKNFFTHFIGLFGSNWTTAYGVVLHVPQCLQNVGHVVRHHLHHQPVLHDGALGCQVRRGLESSIENHKAGAGELSFL